MLGESVGELPALEACLVDFAQSLTARPWTIGPADLRPLSAAGLSRTSIALVIGLVAMFNYLTRVADGTGIEADYGGTLPQFSYRGRTESIQRPDPADWPAVDGSRRLLSLLPDTQAAWDRWHEYVLESPAPIPVATRRQLQSIAARNACDSAIGPVSEADSSLPEPLARFAETLSRTPWLVTSPDVEELRSIGLDDVSILHAIAVVAYQSAESRLRVGLSALARFEPAGR